MPGFTLAGEMPAAIRRGEAAPRPPRETLFHAVARIAFRDCERVWKAGTLHVNRGCLRNRIPPHFAGRPVADIDRQDEPQRTSRWVFPAPRGEKPRAPAWLDRFRARIRAETDLRDVRLHDLRHTHANIALRQGETVLATARLRPREREYTVWDNRVPSLGRVRRSGGKSYLLPEETGGRWNRAALGPASTRSVEEARTECHGRQANPEPEMPARSARSLLMFREFVEGPWEDA